jgi:hypothetical protein
MHLHKKFVRGFCQNFVKFLVILFLVVTKVVKKTELTTSRKPN